MRAMGTLGSLAHGASVVENALLWTGLAALPSRGRRDRAIRGMSGLFRCVCMCVGLV